ncbi:MAG: SRPBCC family protein [Chitinophagaceae bacterium]
MEHNDQYGSWHADNEFQPHQGRSNTVNVNQSERIISAALGGYLLSSSLHNLLRNPIGGLVKTVISGILLYRGISGNCPVYSSMGKTRHVSHTPAINIRTTMRVNKPKDEVYAFWRKLENLPLFMKHLASVTEIDAKHSHWEAIIPGNIGKIKWNAEIVKEEPGYLIGWQSIANSTINNAGKVIFNDAQNGQGTELEVVISYHPPAGELGAGIAKVLNPMFEKIIRKDVMNFKEYIETKHSTTGITGSTPSMSAGSGSGINTGSTPGTGSNKGAGGKVSGGNGDTQGTAANRFSNP